MWRYALSGTAVVAGLVVALAVAVHVSMRPLAPAARMPRAAHGSTTHPPVPSAGAAHPAVARAAMQRATGGPTTEKPATPTPGPDGPVAVDLATPHGSGSAPSAPTAAPIPPPAEPGRKLQAQMQALRAQVAEQSAALDRLRAQTGQARQELATLQARGAPANEPPAQSRPQPQRPPEVALTPGHERDFAMVQGVLRRLRRSTEPSSAPYGRGPADAASAAVRPPALSTRYWVRTARQDLAVGDVLHARQVLEAVQTKLVFQPVTPDDPQPAPSHSAAKSVIAQALAQLDAGDPDGALRVLDQALGTDAGRAGPAISAGAERLGRR